MNTYSSKKLDEYIFFGVNAIFFRKKKHLFYFLFFLKKKTKKPNPSLARQPPIASIWCRGWSRPHPELALGVARPPGTGFGVAGHPR
jgi:hypothetical protein